MLGSRQVAILSLFMALSCSVKAEENPESIFSGLLQKYAHSSSKTTKLNSSLDDGVEFSIFDQGKAISNDTFCQISLMATMGQTQYLCYKKQESADWLIKREVLFYSAPYEVRGAETEVLFFRYADGDTRVYNEKTKNYELGKDVQDYEAIVDLPSIRALVELVEKNINE